MYYHYRIGSEVQESMVVMELASSIVMSAGNRGTDYLELNQCLSTEVFIVHGTSPLVTVTPCTVP